MRYEHLVAVNDQSNPFGYFVSRQQLWRGLMLRVEKPQTFIPGVESVVITRRSDCSWLREMKLGVLLVRDMSSLRPEELIRFETEPSERHRGGSLLITIEEPEQASLFVRFCYEIPASDDPEDEQYEDYLKQMWRQVDVECVRMIRGLAEAGRFDGALL